MAMEPIFSIQITCEDGGEPVNYFGLKLTDALDILKLWDSYWILIPDIESYLDGIWRFYARPRDDNGMSWPEFKDIFVKDVEDKVYGNGV